MMEVILKRFEAPDEVRVFPKGRFEVVGDDEYVSLHFLGAASYAR